MTSEAFQAGFEAHRNDKMRVPALDPKVAELIKAASDPASGLAMEELARQAQELRLGYE